MFLLNRIKNIRSFQITLRRHTGKNHNQNKKNKRNPQTFHPDIQNHLLTVHDQQAETVPDQHHKRKPCCHAADGRGKPQHKNFPVEHRRKLPFRSAKRH